MWVGLVEETRLELMSKAEYPPLASEGRVHMDDTTNATLDQADEDILTPTVSDDALEAAAGSPSFNFTQYTYHPDWRICENLPCVLRG